jgi:hypothetical protein
MLLHIIQTHRTATAKGGPGADYRLREAVTCQRRSIAFSSAPPCSGMLTVGEAVHLWGQGTYGASVFCAILLQT